MPQTRDRALDRVAGRVLDRVAREPLVRRALARIDERARAELALQTAGVAPLAQKARPTERDGEAAVGTARSPKTAFTGLDILEAVKDPKKLRNAAETNGWVRTAMDIRRVRVAAAEWDVVPIDPMKGYDQAARERMIAGLERPNGSQESFRATLEVGLEDLMALDQGCFEKELSVGGEILAWYYVDAAKVAFNKQWTGAANDPRYFWLPKQYAQKVPIYNDEMIVMQARQASYRMVGLSSLQVLARTIESIWVSAEFQLQMAKQHPPSGMLFLPQFSEPQVQTVRARYEGEIAGNKGLFMVGYGTDGTGKPEYVPLLYNAQTMMWEAWTAMLVREIAIVFGLSPLDLGLERDVNRSTAAQQTENARDTGLIPMMKLVKGYLDREYIQTFRGAENLQFMFTALNDADEMAAAELTAKLAPGLPLLTFNEARHKNGKDPLPLGDAVYVMTPAGPVPFIGPDAEAARAQRLQQTVEETLAVGQAQLEVMPPEPKPAPASKAATAKADDAEPGTLDGPEEASDPTDSEGAALVQHGHKKLVGFLLLLAQAYEERMAAYLDLQPLKTSAAARASLAAHYASERLRQDATRDAWTGQGLPGLLAEYHLEVARQTIERELHKLGLGDTPVPAIADPAFVRVVRARCARRAQGIVDTFARDALRRVKAAGAASEAEILGDLRTWGDERCAWKATQVAQTELAVARHEALRAFVSRNALDGTARAVPPECADSRCQALVDQGWVPIRRALNWRLPLHTNCKHFLESRLIPPPRLLWTGR